MSEDTKPEIRFYHLQKQTLDQALPLILNKAIAKHKILVKLPDAESVKTMSQKLWIYRPDSFLAHGSAKDEHPEDHPIWLTHDNDNPNAADMIVTGNGSAPDNPEDFALACEFLNGFDDSDIQAGRQRWKAYKDKGYTLSYWQQDDRGAWSQKV